VVGFIKKTILTANILFAVILYAQKTNFNTVLNGLSVNNFSETKTALNKIDTTKISAYDKATWLYYNADYNFRLDNHHFAFKNITLSKNIFDKLNKKEDVIDCNILLLAILSHQNNLKINTDQILNELEKYLKTSKNLDKNIKIYNRIATNFYKINDGNNAIKYFNKMIPLGMQLKDTATTGQVYTNIGVVYDNILKNTDSSLYYYKKATPFLIKYQDNQSLSYNYNNQGNTYKNLKKYDSAILYYDKSRAIPLKKFIAKSNVLYYENLSEAYNLKKDYYNESIYLNKLIVLKDSINDIKQNIEITGIKEKYDNEKLRADNLQIEADKTRNKNLLIISLLLLLFGSITSFLVHKNNKKKRKIIQTEKLFEQQKVSNLLKEQELIAIDAMIAGQEKERQLIASDLHDDLGALMATLQFNFENLQKHKNSADSETLFTQTKLLIKEAYQKIRRIANVKDSGVFAKQGLLKAIINNANKISKLNKINIEVRSHGLKNRLENSLELTIFRIVQELITNVIKHAKATEVIIHFTNHKDSLNIMVEDNGKGFDINNISKSDGMGIQSIEKRIESIEGTIVIESFINKGTTIIIDIPL